MTREEEKNKARFEYVSKRLANPDYPTYNDEYELECAYDAGTMWADAHPDIDVRTMAAWQSGYKEAIEKACEWLRTNLCEHYADEPIAHKMGRPISGYISFFEEPPVAVIGDFLKAMKGGSQ
jgi:hypothetical protein